MSLETRLAAIEQLLKRLVKLTDELAERLNRGQIDPSEHIPSGVRRRIREIEEVLVLLRELVPEWFVKR